MYSHWLSRQPQSGISETFERRTPSCLACLGRAYHAAAPTVPHRARRLQPASSRGSEARTRTRQRRRRNTGRGRAEAARGPFQGTRLGRQHAFKTPSPVPPELPPSRASRPYNWASPQHALRFPSPAWLMQWVLRQTSPFEVTHLRP